MPSSFISPSFVDSLRLSLSIVLVVPLLAGPVGPGRAAASPPSPVVVERRVALMGTTCTLGGVATSREEGLRGLEAAIAALETAEQRLSTWRPASALSLLNQSSPQHPTAVAPGLAALLARVAVLSRETAGAFDPAVGSLIAAWDLRGAGRVPRPDEIDAALGSSGMDLFSIDVAAATVTRHASGVWIDAGGFGKGVGLAAATQALTAAGLTDGHIDLGGQVALSIDGRRRVAVAHPRHRQQSAAWLALVGESAATSSDSENRFVVDGQTIGHILDPRSGRPAADFGSVTVVSRDPLVADALSTALFVLGPEAGMQLAAQRADIEALFLIAGRNGVHAVWTSGLDGRIELVAGVLAATPVSTPVPSDGPSGVVREVVEDGP